MAPQLSLQRTTQMQSLSNHQGGGDDLTDLECGWTAVQEEQHVDDILRVLDDEVGLQLELTTHQLEKTMRSEVIHGQGY